MREQLQNAARLENDEENEQSLTVIVEDFPIEEENLFKILPSGKSAASWLAIAWSIDRRIE